VRSPWLFVIVFLAYLVGPAPPKHDPREPLPLASLSSIPFLRLMDAVYPAAEPADQVRWAGRVAGALLAGATVAVTFEALKAVVFQGSALVLALLAGFASPLWSWASRTDTIEAPTALVVALLLWLAARGPRGSPVATALRAGASGVLAALLWGLDPSLGAAFPLAMLVSVRGEPWTRRDALLSATGAVATALLVWRLGTGPGLLPHLTAFDPAAFAAYLVSPGRGLVLFVPITALAVAAVLRRDEPRRLVRGAGLAVLVALAQVACLDDPWGPQTFGPAFLAPILPLLAVMASALPMRALRWASLISLPVVVAHAAAVRDGRFTWDARRVPVAHADAVWDWRDSPFSDLFFGPPAPDPALFLPGASMLPGEHPTRAGDVVPWLAFGWEAPEATGTWASGRESWVVLAVPPGDYTLTLTAAAPGPRDGGQRLEIVRPGGPPIAVAFTGGVWDFQPVTIPFRPDAGIAVLKIHPAQTFRPGRGDLRALSFFVSSLRLQHKRG
jgi:hypothetical protein